MTRPSATAPSTASSSTASAALGGNLDTIQNVLSQFIRLSRPPSLAPEIPVSADALATATEAQDTAAPWTWTTAEASTAEAVLLPFLIHLAAARNDLESLRYCIDTERTFVGQRGDNQSMSSSTGDLAGQARRTGIAGGIINCLDPGSGRSPLHVAALNGHTRAVELLLQSGALVHLRDTLGHTALYYVCIHNRLPVFSNSQFLFRPPDKVTHMQLMYLSLREPFSEVLTLDL